MREAALKRTELIMSGSASRMERLASRLGESVLFGITSMSLLAIFFIFYFIARDALPFFEAEGFGEFFLSGNWYPAGHPASFGAKAIFFGSFLVTGGAILVAVPMGIGAAVCLSDILPFGVRQIAKPVVEMLASIPSVAYGFFALVVLAPQLQEGGGHMLSVALWIVGIPFILTASLLTGGWFASVLPGQSDTAKARISLVVGGVLLTLLVLALVWASSRLAGLQINSGANALNVSIILGIMAFPTVVSVSEDALQAVGRELREASYGLGATRAETILRVVIPAAASGICAAIILGIMRAVGETMVVWMASGNAAHIPEPWYDVTQPIRTLTATIAGEMGEADQMTGSSRFHVLFAQALSLLVISFACNVLSEWIIKYNRRRLKGEVG